MRRQRKKLKDLDCVAFFLTMKWYIHLACLRSWWHFTTLLDIAVKVMGFWAEEKFQWGLRFIMSRRLLGCHYFGLLRKISIFNWHNPICDPVLDPVRDLIRDPVRDPVRDPIWSDPDFVDADNSTLQPWWEHSSITKRSRTCFVLLFFLFQ